jgi:hypothetical protein
MSRSGYIYIMFMPEMPHCLKVGCTAREPRVRATELSGTATPLPFRVLMQWSVSDKEAAEQAAHNALGDARLAENREFFRIHAPEAIHIVGQAIIPFLVKCIDPDLEQRIRTACAETRIPASSVSAVLYRTHKDEFQRVQSAQGRAQLWSLSNYDPLQGPLEPQAEGRPDEDIPF